MLALTATFRAQGSHILTNPVGAFQAFLGRTSEKIGWFGLVWLFSSSPDEAPAGQSDWRQIKLAKMSTGRPTYGSAHSCTAGTRPRPMFRHFGHLANTLSAKPARNNVPGEPESRDPPPPEESGWFSGAGTPQGRAERLCPPRGGNGGPASAGAREVPCVRTGQASAAAPPAASGPGWWVPRCCEAWVSMLCSPRPQH